MVSAFRWLGYFGYLKLRVEAILTSVGTIILMLTFLRTHSIALDEGGNLYPIIHVGTGFWLWMASAIPILSGSLLSMEVP